MDITFKSAVSVSAFIHALILAPLYDLSVPEHRLAEKKPVVVEYIKVKEPERVVPKKVPDATGKEEAGAAIPETARIELSQKAVLSPPEALPEAPRKAETEKASLRETAEREARLKSTKEYAGYYQLLREKIRRRLKENYRPYHGEGDVSLSFIVAADGTLEGLEVERAASTSNETLVSIAASSVRNASPFPEFPEELDSPRMSFSLIISFKKR